MATQRMQGIVLFVACVYIVLELGCTDALPDISKIEEWGTMLESALHNKVILTSGIQIIQQKYNAYDSSKLNIVSTNGEEIATELAEEISKILGKKMEAVKRLANKVEQLEASYMDEQNISREDISYMNSKDFKDQDARLEYNEHFKRFINTSGSGIHIPLEIYNEDPKVLNGIRWTQGLDEEFKRNRQLDPSLLWQFYSSQTGFLRIFPASKWETPPDGKPDLYDARRRPWYTQGSSSPKDMMILIDVSGSVHGQTLELMKLTAKALLDTLGEDDFVNIVPFNNIANFIGCFDTFVQANGKNKRTLLHFLDRLESKNMASYATGLEFVFKEFEKFRANATDGQGAHCNQIIMLLTDGGTEMPKETFEKYNWPDKKIRVFTYSVGHTTDPIAAVKWMACQNKGYFSTIPSLGTIRNKVQEYIPVLSRPMVLSGEKHFLWSNPYLDAMGLGMTSTVTLPVFNKHVEMQNISQSESMGSIEQSNQTLLGIVGIDVRISDLTKLIPKKKLGPSGYAFMINHNGYVLFHPELKEQSKYVKETQTVDFLDLEYEDELKEKVRRNMIDGKPGKRTVATYVKSPDGKYISQRKRSYSYSPVKNTSFSFGVVTASQSSIEVSASNMESLKGLDQVRNETAIFIAPWNFCGSFPLNLNSYEKVTYLSEKIKKEYYSTCDSKLVQHLLLDLDSSGPLVEFWENQQLQGKRSEIYSTFLSTHGGLTRFFPPSLADDQNVKLRFEDSWKSSFYHRALDNDFFTFMADTRQYGEEQALITAVKAVIKEGTPGKNGGDNFTVGVVGVQLNHSVLLKIFNDSSQESQGCNEDYVYCYLLDDGGFVVASNQEDSVNAVGMFLGKVDANLMRSLYDSNVYQREEDYNYEAICPNVNTGISSGPRSVFIPSLAFNVLSLNWLVETSKWAIMNYNLYSLLMAGWSSLTEARSYTSRSTINLPPERYCIKLQYQYYFDQKSQKTSLGMIECGNCTRRFVTRRIQNTNLLMVISEYPCKECPLKLMIQEPHEVVSNASCNMKIRYRRRPKTCVDNHSDENSSICAACSVDVPSLVVLLINTVVLLALTLVSH